MQHISKGTYLPSSTFPNLLHAILHYSFRRKRMKKSKTRLEPILIRAYFRFIFVLNFFLKIENSSLPCEKLMRSYMTYEMYLERLVVHFCFLFCASPECLEGYWYQT